MLRKQSSRVVVSSTNSRDKQELIDGARLHGYKVTGKQIDRWRADKLLPEPSSKGQGQGKGVVRSSPAGTLKQLVALCGIMKRNRSLDLAAFRLWIGGYDIPTARFRKVLDRVVVRAFEKVQQQPEKALAEIDKAQERLVRRKSVRQRVRTLAKNAELTPMFMTMLQFVLGQQESQSDLQRHDFVQVYEKAAALERAKIDTVNGKAWLSGDASEQILDTFNGVAELPAILRSATDEAIGRARKTFLQIEQLMTWARHVQEQYGPDAFGVGALTDGIVGLDMEAMAPFMFAGFLMLEKSMPDIHERATSVGEAVSRALESLTSIEHRKIKT